MAITQEQLKEVKHRLERAARPLIFYDDDHDGLASYLLCKKFNNESRGVRAARGPELDVNFAHKVNEHMPDLILILDKPRVSRDFFSEVQTPIIWIDHHDLSSQHPHEMEIKNLTYLNPRIEESSDRRPVSLWMHKALGGPAWIAAVGATGDWDANLIDKFREDYPQYAPKTNDIKEALYESKLGQLVEIFNLSLKGNTSQIKKKVSALSKVDNPEELLEKTTPRAKWLEKQNRAFKEEFEQQFKEANNQKTKNGIFIYIYNTLQTSMLSEVSNKLLVTKEADIIILGREDNGHIRMSLRSHHYDLRPLVEAGLEGIDGHGGGHKEACGASVPSENLKEFIEQISDALNKVRT